MNKQDLLGRVMMSVATIMVGLLPIAVDLEFPQPAPIPRWKWARP